MATGVRARPARIWTWPARARLGAGGHDLNDEAKAWALSADPDDTLFTALVCAVEAQIGDLARRLASKIISGRADRLSEDADAIVNAVWASLWQHRGYDPERGGFAAFFLAMVRNRSIDFIRARATARVPNKVIARLGAEQIVGEQLAANAYDEAIKELDSFRLEDRLRAVIEVLDLTNGQREMLRQMLGDDPGASGSAAGRKAQERTRNRVLELAGLTQEEEDAAKLMRKHHTIAGAAKSSRLVDNDLESAYQSARRKVLALFGVDDG